MATKIFLGEPPTDIKEWIIEHSSPAGHADTWYKYEGDTEWRTVSIKGIIYGEYLDDQGETPTQQIPNIMNVKELDIGTDVTYIDQMSFIGTNLTSIIIPNTITTIEENSFTTCNVRTITIDTNPSLQIKYDVFANCYELTNLTFKGKTLAEVQAMTNYPWGISNASIINVA